MRKNVWKCAVAVAGALAACAIQPINRDTVVRVSGRGEQFQLHVDTERADIGQLADVTFSHAIENNEGLSRESVHADARVVICADANLRYAVVQDVVLRLRLFGNKRVAVAGTDCAQ